MTQKLTKKQMDGLLSTVEGLLAKAVGDTDESSAPADSAPPSDGPPDSPSDSSSAPSAPDNAPAADSGAVDNGPTTPSPDGGGDPAADQGPMSAEALQAEYAALPPEELQMHLMAVTAAYQQFVAGQDAGGGDPAASAPPAPDAPPPAADASAGGPPPEMSATKSQDKDLLDRLSKAEQAISSVPLLVQQLQAVQAENESLKKSVGQVNVAAGLMTALLETQSGRRKAVTGTTAPQKVEKSTKAPEEMTKSELNQNLVAVVKSTPGLKKSDRDAVMKFVSDSNASVESIRHLVK